MGGWLVTEDMLPANTNQALAIIRISDEQVYLPYVKLILTSPIVIGQFERKKQGVAQLNLSLKDINELSIPLPSKKKQIEIAELFAKIINVISKRKEELKALDDLIKARFVEMFGDPIQNPKGYLKETINKHIDLLSGYPFKSEQYVDEGINICGGLIIMPQKIKWDECVHFTSIVCALISGIVTYMVSRKQTKNEINKLIKQHELNLESQRKQYEHEIAILNLEHEHQLKLKDKELENKLSGDMMNTLISEAMKNPEIKKTV